MCFFLQIMVNKCDLPFLLQDSCVFPPPNVLIQTRSTIKFPYFSFLYFTLAILIYCCVSSTPERDLNSNRPLHHSTTPPRASTATHLNGWIWQSLKLTDHSMLFACTIMAVYMTLTGHGIESKSWCMRPCLVETQKNFAKKSC